MALSTMLFGDEVLPPDRIDELDALEEAEATKRELTMAQQLIDSLSAEFDPGKFKDEYRERVLDLIERKAAGEEIAVAPEAEETAPAPDLMAALEASLAEVRSGSSDSVSESGKSAGKSSQSSSSSSKSSGSSSKPSKSSKSSGSPSKSSGSNGAKASSAKGSSRAKAKS
jgi:DNA end-binding protein Ku